MRTSHKWSWVAAAAAAVLVAGAVTAPLIADAGDGGRGDRQGWSASDEALRPLGELFSIDWSDPRQQEISVRSGPTSAGEIVAIAAQGARTVHFRARSPRTFTEPGSNVVVTTQWWVRIGPSPWSADAATDPDYVSWFLGHIDDTGPDVLTVAAEYLRGAPEKTDSAGRTYAGDAGFGIERGDQTDGADFNEYMGVPWTFPSGRTVEAKPSWKGRLDCSGYVRIVYGYRGGLTLHYGPVEAGVEGLPRTAHSIAYDAAQATIAEGPTRARPPKRTHRALPGDLAFFALRDNPARVSHSGILLGYDQDGRMRFVSSRDSTDGPSFANSSGTPSALDAGFWARSLRRISRL